MPNNYIIRPNFDLKLGPTHTNNLYKQFDIHHKITEITENNKLIALGDYQLHKYFHL